MNTESPQPGGVAARLRAEFDRMFAVAASPLAQEQAVFLAIRLGGDPFALPLRELVGIHVDRKVVAVPSAAPTLLGIAAFRGALIPVHDLGRLLGYPARAEARWIALVSAAAPVGLAFDAFEGQFATSAAAATTTAAATEPRAALAPPSGPPREVAGLTRGLVSVFDAVRPVIDVAAVVASIGDGAAPQRPARAR